MNKNDNKEYWSKKEFNDGKYIDCLLDETISKNGEMYLNSARDDDYWLNQPKKKWVDVIYKETIDSKNNLWYFDENGKKINDNKSNEALKFLGKEKITKRIGSWFDNYGKEQIEEIAYEKELKRRENQVLKKVDVKKQRER